MNIDMTQVRSDITAYRRRFDEKWQEEYGVPFAHSQQILKSMVHNPLATESIEDAVIRYQDRIRYIKSLVKL